MAKIEIQRVNNGKFSFILKSRNGSKQLISVPFETKEECHKAIGQTKQLVMDRTNIQMMKTNDCEPYFIIGNEKILARSQVYASVANLRESIKPLQRNLSVATVEDQT